ncbi:MAG: hypothetical protein QM775_31645 [Pirellulales bacterium]
MPFTFYCPQGHLLEGQESQQGTQGRCPTCASVFVFPSSGGTAGFPAFDAAYGPGVSAPATTSSPSFSSAPRILKILCPRGHELPTPEDLLGTTTICPYCNQSVVVSMENSVEHRNQLQAAQRERDDASNRFLMRIVMTAGALGVAAVGGMIWYVMSNR